MGIIVRLTVKIVPAKERIVVFNLVYNDVATYLADAEKVMAAGKFEVQAG